MVKDDEKFTPNSPVLDQQPDLFRALDDVEPAYLAANAPDMDIEAEFMGAIKYALRLAKKHGLGRERVVERMNMCLAPENHVTERQLNAWCAESQEYKRFPAIHIPAFIWAVRGVVSPLEIITRSLELHLLDEREVLAAELGKTAMAKAEANKMERLLKQKLQR